MPSPAMALAEMSGEETAEFPVLVDPGARWSSPPEPAGADPGTTTQVIAMAVLPGTATPSVIPPPAWTPHSLPRPVAAEVGMYAGAAMVGLAAALVVVADWELWSPPARVAVVAAGGLGAFAGAAWVRASGSTPPGDTARRATSSLLVLGWTILAGASCAAMVTLAHTAWAGPATAGLAATAAVGINLVARTPLSESAVLVGVVALAATLAGPLGIWMLPVVAALGLAWAVGGWRALRGRRTAVVAGLVTAVGACVAAANGTWEWPARAGLLVVGGSSLVAFLRGGRNHWLALGVASSAALAATLAGELLGPLLALAIGGLATLAVSAVALRATRQPGAKQPGQQGSEGGSSPAHT